MAKKLRFLAIADIGLLLLTVSIAFAALIDARRHSERELRAYVVVKPVKVVGLRSNDKPVVQIVLQNAGATPVHKMRYLLGMHVYERGKVDFIPPTTTKKMREQLPGGNSFHLERLIELSGIRLPDTEVTRQLRSDELQRIRDGVDCLYIVGFVVYDDIFGKSHCTKCAFYYMGNTEVAHFCDTDNDTD